MPYRYRFDATYRKYFANLHHTQGPKAHVNLLLYKIKCDKFHQIRSFPNWKINITDVALDRHLKAKGSINPTPIYFYLFVNSTHPPHNKTWGNRIILSI